MTFPYMHIMYFDHIHPLFLMSPLAPPFPSPSTSLVVSPFAFMTLGFFVCLFCYLLDYTNERKHAILVFVRLVCFI
jgi:hypothetical protein